MVPKHFTQFSLQPAHPSVKPDRCAGKLSFWRRVSVWRARRGVNIPLTASRTPITERPPEFPRRRNVRPSLPKATRDRSGSNGFGAWRSWVSPPSNPPLSALRNEHAYLEKPPGPRGRRDLGRVSRHHHGRSRNPQSARV